jgi:hypothetical protein
LMCGRRGRVNPCLTEIVSLRLRPTSSVVINHISKAMYCGRPTGITPSAWVRLDRNVLEKPVSVARRFQGVDEYVANF